MASIGSDFPDCARCRSKGKAQLREKWGCDANSTKVASWWMGCDCAGTNPDCPRCKGKGTVAMKRCPSSMLESSSDSTISSLIMAMTLYNQYDARQVLPAPGGWLEQSPCFLALVQTVDGERGRWEKLRDEHSQRQRKSEAS